MSAFVMSKQEIDILTTAADVALRLNQKYPGSYPLNAETVELLGKYDLHNLYRALFITNIKAVNGRYSEDTKTLPRYTKLIPWEADASRLSSHNPQKACGLFGCYMYQLSEDPVYGSPVFKAFYDVYKLLSMILVSKLVDWNGEAA